MVQPARGSSVSAAARPAPGHAPTRRAGRPGAAVPDGADPAGGLLRPVHRHPGGGARRLPAVAPVAALPGASAREGARHAREDLLQVRGCVAGRVAQAQHGGRPGVLQRAGRRPPAHHRDRSRPVGHRPRIRLRAVRTRLRDLDGTGVVRPEAVPQDHDGDLRRRRPPVAVGPHQRRPRHPRPASGLDRQPRHRHLRGGRGGGPGPADQLRAGQRAQPCAAAPDGHRAGGARAVRPGGPDSGPDRRLHRWRVQLRRARLPVPRREAGRAYGRHDPRRRTGELPVADEGRVRVRLRRHGRDDPTDEDAHARARLHPRSHPRGRPALPRHVAADLAHLRAGSARGGREDPAGVLRGGCAVRPYRGNHPRARADPRAGRLHRGGPAVQGDRRVEGDPDRPMWTRTPGPRRVRRVSRWRPSPITN